MRKLQALMDALIEAHVVAMPEQIRGVIDSGDPIRSGANTATGVRILNHEYQCHVEIKKAQGDIRHLLAVVMAYMIDTDEQYDEFSGWDGEIADDHTSTINLRFKFCEDVHLVEVDPDYTGQDRVTLGGTLYKLADDQVSHATELSGLTVEIG